MHNTKQFDLLSFDTAVWLSVGLLFAVAAFRQISDIYPRTLDLTVVSMKRRVGLTRTKFGKISQILNCFL